MDPGQEPPELFPDGVIWHNFYREPQTAMALELTRDKWRKAMIKFFRKLFKKNDDLAPHLRKYHRQLDLPPEVRVAFTRGPQSDTIPNASGRFGYDKSNPIPVCQPKGELDYLARLRCKCGEPFIFHRIGSFGSGPDGHIVDGYELVCKSRQHHITLYMDMYHAGPSSLVPEELSAGPPGGIGLPLLVKNFPASGRILIVERYGETREKIRKALSLDPDIEIVGTVTRGDRAVQMAVELQPDIILMEIELPGMDGITATEKIVKQLPTIQVILTGSDVQADDVRRAMLAGAKDILTKPFSNEELVRTIRRAYHLGAIRQSDSKSPLDPGPQ